MRVVLLIVSALVFLALVTASPVGRLEAHISQAGAPSSAAAPAAASPAANAAKIAELEKRVADNAKKIDYYNVRQSQVNPDGTKKTSGRFAKKTAAAAAPAPAPTPAPTQATAPAAAASAPPAAPARVSDSACSQEWMFQESVLSKLCPADRPYRRCVGYRGNGGFGCTAKPDPKPTGKSIGATDAQKAQDAAGYNPNARCGNTYGSCQGDPSGPCCKALGQGGSGFYCGTC